MKLDFEISQLSPHYLSAFLAFFFLRYSRCFANCSFLFALEAEAVKPKDDIFKSPKVVTPVFPYCSKVTDTSPSVLISLMVAS